LQQDTTFRQGIGGQKPGFFTVSSQSQNNQQNTLQQALAAMASQSAAQSSPAPAAPSPGATSLQTPIALEQGFGGLGGSNTNSSSSGGSSGGGVSGTGINGAVSSAAAGGGVAAQSPTTSSSSTQQTGQQTQQPSTASTINNGAGPSPGPGWTLMNYGTTSQWSPPASGTSAQLETALNSQASKSAQSPQQWSGLGVSQPALPTMNGVPMQPGPLTGPGIHQATTGGPAQPGTPAPYMPNVGTVAVLPKAPTTPAKTPVNSNAAAFAAAKSLGTGGGTPTTPTTRTDSNGYTTAGGYTDTVSGGY